LYRNGLQAYQSVNKITVTGRETEANVLNQSALRLKRCFDTWDGSLNHEKELDEALRTNQKIWTLFQLELMQEDHPLPKKLRVDLLRLSAFIDRRTYDLLAFPDKAKLPILIDINNNIAAGLRETP
jgi:flagellar biosynthesis activator protein FlaF